MAMDYFIVTLTLLSLILCVWIFDHHVYRRRSRTRSSTSKSSKLLPPGPFPLPIIGSLIHLGQHPHRSLANLSKIYGPLNTMPSAPAVAHLMLPQQRTTISSPWSSCHPEPNGENYGRYAKSTCLFTLTKLQASEPLRKQKISYDSRIYAP